MSCDCDVTCLFIVTKKKKKFKRKRNIKSRKIDKRKRKMLVSKVFYNKLEERRQSTVKYQRLGVQGATGEEISRLICRSIYNQRGGIHQCGQIATANLDEDPSSCEHQLDSTIQGTSRGAEKRRREMN